MAAPSEHTHHIKIRSTQMEMASSGLAGRTEDFDRKLKDADTELERIQQQREELERKKTELEELTSRKRAFISQQVELGEKLTSSLTLIDRELFEIRNEAEDLEQCRSCFAAHLDKIQKNLIDEAMDKSGKNISKAAQALGISRRTLHRKLAQSPKKGKIPQ